MYFPRGRWYDYWSGELIEGGMEKWVLADIDSIPLYIKEGAIIPRYPVQQYVGEKQITELALDIYYKEGIENSTVYEDAQEGYDYTKGYYSLRNFKLSGKESELIIQQFKNGTYITPYEHFRINLIGLPFAIKSIEVDNVEVPLKEVKPNGDNTILVHKDFTELHIIGS
jgi:alpha-glucosidase